MRAQLSASTGARCADCPPIDFRQPILMALVVASLGGGGVLLWRVLLDHTGDALVAAMLVALAALALIGPSAKLLKSYVMPARARATTGRCRSEPTPSRAKYIVRAAIRTEWARLRKFASAKA